MQPLYAATSLHLGEFLPPVAAMAAYALPYAVRTRTLRREGRPVPAWRQACFAAGTLLILAVTTPPADRLADSLLAAHMAQHLVLGDLAALLIALGLTGPVLQPLLRHRPNRALAWLGNPLVAFPLWALNLYAWHVPALYQAALRHDLVHSLQHACFFFFGLNMWLALLGPLPKPAWFGNFARLVYVVAVRLTAMVLGNVLIWSATVFYPYYASGERAYGMSPLRDQGLAGGLMMIEGSIVTIALFGWLFMRAAGQSERSQRLVEYAAAHGVELSPERAARAVAAGREQELRARLGGTGDRASH
jgi:cytochrome c oxidase assembly factor CtaG